MVQDRWAKILARQGPQRGSVECWSAAGAALRTFLRGWGANFGSHSKRERGRLIEEIAALDAQADARQFSEAEWAHR